MGADKLKQAIYSLDPTVDANWTADGLPRMDVIEKLLNDKAITRQMVTDADPEFCRDVATKRRMEAEAKAKAEERENDISNKVSEEGQKETPQEEQIDPEEQLQSDILKLDEQIREKIEARSKIEKEIDALNRQRDGLQEKSFGRHSAANDTKGRLKFIESQNKLRAERHKRGQQIIQIVGKQNLDPRSKLDRAMSRKTARGTKRPPARLMNNQKPQE